MKVKKQKKNDRFAFFNADTGQYQNWRRSKRAMAKTARELADTHVANQLQAQERGRILGSRA